MVAGECARALGMQDGNVERHETLTGNAADDVSSDVSGAGQFAQSRFGGDLPRGGAPGD